MIITLYHVSLKASLRNNGPSQLNTSAVERQFSDSSESVRELLKLFECFDSMVNSTAL